MLGARTHGTRAQLPMSAHEIRANYGGIYIGTHDSQGAASQREVRLQKVKSMGSGWLDFKENKISFIRRENSFILSLIPSLMLPE